MKTAWVVMGLVCLSVCIQSAGAEKGELTDALTIFKKADAAAKAVTAVRYEASFKGTGANQARQPAVEGRAVLVGNEDQQTRKAQLEGKITLPGSSESKPYRMGTDGENFWLIDVEAKRGYADIDPEVVGRAGRMLRTALTMQEYIHPRPFGDEIDGKAHEFKGIEDVAGERCYHVFVQYDTPQRPQEAHWYFSTEDLLPRRVDRWFPPREEDGEGAGTQLIVRNLDADPKVDDATFAFKLPDGFEQIDDFAP